MFYCALRPAGEPLGRTDLFGALSRLRAGGQDVTVEEAGPFVAMANAGSRAEIARRGALVAVGEVRLDNRAELMALARGGMHDDATDLAVVLAAIDAQGESCIGRILGDFAFVLWDARAQKALAVRDAFGVRALFVRDGHGLVNFSSHIELLQSDERPDLDYIADFLVGLPSHNERTIWSDVRAVPAAMYARQQGTVRTLHRHWDARDIAERSMPDADAAAQFADLLADAIRVRSEPGVTWAELSGGVDSSAIVTHAIRRFGPTALAGTVTVVDALGEGDERRYVDAVLAQTGLANVQLHDHWAWQDDGIDPPHSDEPQPLYPFYARDRHCHALLRDAGARIVLSGLGADHYLTGSLDYLTDLTARGRVPTAVRETASWAVAQRQSFWRLARRQLVEPFLPARMRQAPPVARMPRWLRADYAKRFDLAGRMPFGDRFAGRPGERQRTQSARHLESLQGWTRRPCWGDDVELRYPFLHRPLVEHALSLEPRQHIRPVETKWILREAMRGTLPEVVRTRSSKGGIDARILWSLQHEAARIDDMLRHSTLADLGVVDADQLMAAVDAARRGIRSNNVQLMSALALESWFSARAGRLASRTAARTAA